MTDRVEHGVCLLPFNPGAGDTALLTAALVSTEDVDNRHVTGMSIRDYAKRNPSSELIPALLLCYETAACSFCRRHTVEYLIAANALPPETVAECAYDANVDTREEVALLLEN